MRQEDKINHFYQNAPERSRPQPREENRFAVESKNALLQWQAPEYETYEKDRKWYIIFGAVMISALVYALVTNNPIVAITFILIGLTLYVLAHKPPRIIDFHVTPSKISADHDEYPFKDLKSFWIFYDEHKQVLSIETSGKIDPYVHLPLGDTDPVAVREILLEHVPEEEHDERFIDVIQRLLKL